MTIICGLNRTFYGIETLIVPFMELKRVHGRCLLPLVVS